MKPLTEKEIDEYEPCSDSDCDDDGCAFARALNAARAKLDCGKDIDCADEIETQEQCKKHYEVYMERQLAETRRDRDAEKVLRLTTLDYSAAREAERDAAIEERDEQGRFASQEAQHCTQLREELEQAKARENAKKS